MHAPKIDDVDTHTNTTSPLPCIRVCIQLCANASPLYMSKCVFIVCIQIRTGACPDPRYVCVLHEDFVGEGLGRCSDPRRRRPCMSPPSSHAVFFMFMSLPFALCASLYVAILYVPVCANCATRISAVLCIYLSTYVHCSVSEGRSCPSHVACHCLS